MTLLLLAGAGEARRLAWDLVPRGTKVIASFGRPDRQPDPFPVPHRVGGFGGAEGFEAFLDEAGITAILDVTHPFAAHISARTQMICAGRGLPYLAYVRPPWTPVDGDLWTEIGSEAEAAHHIAPGSCVFVATGRGTLEAYAPLEGCRILVRLLDPPTGPFPFPGGEFLIGRPPFPADRERALFAALGVDVLVVRNAGGAASATKLEAARDLGLPVLMIRRPPPPEPHVSRIGDVLDWVDAL